MNILRETWEREGIVAFNFAMEEMFELMKAIFKYSEGRGTVEDIGKEVADVLVTVGVLEFFAPKTTNERQKLLYSRLAKELKK